MTATQKSSVYRQLYHTANGLEDRLTRPSASSFSKVEGGRTPLLGGRTLAAGVALGVTLLAVYAAVKSLGSDGPEKEPAETEEVEDAGELEPVEDEQESSEEVVPEVVDAGNGVWESTLRLFGLSKNSTPEEEAPDVSTSSVANDLPSVDKSPRTKPSAPKKQKKDQPQESTKKADTRAIHVARGTSLKSVRMAKGGENPNPPDRSQADDPLFSGKYARLSKAALTKSELAWARHLVKMGAPIHGRVGKSFLPLVKSAIIARAKAHGLEPEDMLKVASMESGGDPNAVSGTGAIGIYQFTSRTANLFNLRNRFDMDANIEAGMLLTKDNNKRLPEGTEGPLAAYIAHQIGITSAREVLTAPRTKPVASLRPATRRNISHNVGKNATTVGGYLDANQAKLEQSYRTQVSAAPFRGEVKVALKGAPERVASISPASVSVPSSDVASTLTPTTVVLPEPSSTPDDTYSYKNVEDVQVQPDIETTPEGEQVASSKEADSRVEQSPEQSATYNEVFRMRAGGPLVVI